MGIEISTGSVRVAALSGRGAKTKVLEARSADLPPGVVSGSYSNSNIQDRTALVDALTRCLPGGPRGALRAGLCLPDTIVRAQTLEFDEFPGKAAEQERLIRWRLQKAAAFDLADTALRYQVLRRRDRGFTVLACIAKNQAVREFEQLLLDLGIEPWSVSVSSFSVLNFYAPAMSRRSPAYALTHIMEDAFTTIIAENGAARFYRFKDMKRGSAEEAAGRLLREIEDSVHFYNHMDRQQQSQVSHLYLTGTPPVRDALCAAARAEEVLEVHVLDPASVVPVPAAAGGDLAAALGAGAAV